MRLSLVLTLAASLFFPAGAFAADPANDNVISPYEVTTYTLSADKGKLKSVKVKTETELLARRADDTFILYTTYTDGITIDKASAPGAKPVYKSLETDEMFYTGHRACILPVDLKKGKKVKAVFEQTYVQPEHFSEIILRSPYFVEHGEYRIVVPPALAESTTMSTFDLDSSIQIDSIVGNDGGKTYVIHTHASAPLKREPMAPAPRLSAPRVLVKAEFADANDVYRFLQSHLWVRTQNESPRIAELADRICCDAPTKRAEADSITAWVQNNIRYIADEHSLYGLQPASAAEVLEKRYGDCKGSAMLIRQLLRARGIDGRVVWIGTRDASAYRWSDHPVVACGNHMIAAAFIDGDTLFLDGTSSFSPSGFISPNLRGQQAMIEDTDSCCILYEIPLADVHDTDSITARLKLAGNDLTGRLSRTMTGALKISMANSYTRADAAKRHKLLERLLSYPRKNAHIINPITDLSHPAAASVQFSGDVTESGVARTIADEIYLDLRPLRDIFAETVETKERTRGISHTTPYRFVADFEIELPDGLMIKEIPDVLSVDNPWFVANVAYSLDGNVLRCRATVETRRLDASLDEVKAWNKAVRDVRNLSESQIILSKNN